MGDPAMEHARRSTAEPAKPRAAHEPRKVVMDDAMAPLQDLAKQLDGPDGTHAVSEREHREGVVQQIFAVRAALFEWIATGTKQGIKAIDKSEPPPPQSGLEELLVFAASMVISAAAGSSTVWLSSMVFAKVAASASDAVKAAAKRREKFFEDGLKEGIKKAFKFDPGKPARSLDDVKAAFGAEVDRQRAIALVRLGGEWSRLHDHLLTLSTAELEELSGKVTDGLHDPGQLIAEVGDHTVVAWTNFLARARHGAMRSWDYWEPNGSPGAVKLPDATDPLAGGDRRATVADANVDPAGVDPLLAHHQFMGDKDNCGLLQISLGESGGLIRETGYGMRLDSVGPDVRARIRTMGQVRDLKVNKLVRVCSWRLNPPVPIASFLITADGYIRRSNLGELSLIHMDPQTDKRECLTNLIYGKESADCHIAHDANDAQLATFAEWAQRQSLANLEP